MDYIYLMLEQDCLEGYKDAVLFIRELHSDNIVTNSQSLAEQNFILGRTLV